MPTIPIFVNPAPCDAVTPRYSRVSLPLSRGQIFGVPALSLRNANGEAVAVQSEILGHWPDGSVRMLHLTFAGASGLYQAILGEENAAPVSGLAIEAREGGFWVRNGRLKAQIGGSGLLPSLQLGDLDFSAQGGEHSVEIRVTDGDGAVFRASAAPEIRASLETLGPLRAAIALTGQYARKGQTLLDFRLRFEFLAGVEGFSLSFAFFNRETGRDFLPLRSIEVELRLGQAQNPRFLVCQLAHGLFTRPRLVTTENPLEIRIDDSRVRPYATDFAALEDDTIYPFYLQTPVEVSNWATISDGKRAMGVEMDDFHLLRPKSLHLDENRLCFGIWPESAGVLELQQGRSREVTLRVSLSDAGAPQNLADVVASISQLRDLWQAQLAPEVYAGTEFFDQNRVLPYAPLQNKRFERWLGSMSSGLNSVATFFDLGDTPDRGYRATYLPLARLRRVRGEDGGARYFSSSYQNPALALNDLEDFEPVWVNNEYDVIFALGTEFLRTGDLSLFQKLRWFARHTIEVDFLHFCDHKWLHRAQPAHSARHTTTGAYPSHFWTQGLAQYFFLTGDPDALEIIIALADKTIENLDDPELGPLQSGLNREMGWGVLSLVCAYEASGLQRFDDYARKLLDEARHVGLPDDIPVFSFGHTSLLLALRQYLQVHAGEDLSELRNWFVAFVERAIECSRAAPEVAAVSKKTAGTYSYDFQLAERGAFNSQARKGLFNSTSLALDSLAYAYEITHDRKYLNAGLPSLEAMIDSATFRTPVPEGKPYAMIYRTWINYLKCVAETGDLKAFEYLYP